MAFHCIHSFQHCLDVAVTTTDGWCCEPFSLSGRTSGGWRERNGDSEFVPSYTTGIAQPPSSFRNSTPFYCYTIFIVCILCILLCFEYYALPIRLPASVPSYSNCYFPNITCNNSHNWLRPKSLTLEWQ